MSAKKAPFLPVTVFVLASILAVATIGCDKGANPASGSGSTRFTIKFDANGGTPAAISPVTVDSGSTLESYPVVTRTGYTFAGWRLPIGREYTTSTVITSSVTLRAEWMVAPGGQFNPDIAYSSFTDPRDLRRYRTIAIGNQTWMAEDLNYLPWLRADSNWCLHDLDTNCAIYGRLYNWETAMKVCPDGWHLPDTNEWNALINHAGGDRVAAKKLRSKIGWYQNTGTNAGTDDYGFSALPGYGHYDSHSSSLTSTDGRWWTTVEFEKEVETDAYILHIEFDKDYMGWWNVSRKHNGFSVRCVQD